MANSAITTVGGLVAATQSEQETGTATDVFVSPGRQQFHDSAAKVWASISSAGSVLGASYNCTSVSKGATGTYTLTIATDFSGSTYAPAGSGSDGINISFESFTTGTLGIKSRDLANNLADSNVFMAIFGDQ